jgi:ADP-ribosylglycohydrolase
VASTGIVAFSNCNYYFISMKKEKRKAIIFGALAADSLSLGSHWVYNIRAIEKRLGRPAELTDPIVSTFHPNRKKGEFTHYGDQVLWLLEHLADKGGYDSAAFFEQWKENMKSYDGYMDHASKDTLESGRASEMDDLAGAGRTSALASLYLDDPEALADAAEDQAMLTHNNPLVADVSRFFSYLLFEEEGMEHALETVLKKESWKSKALAKGVEAGIASAGKDTSEVIEAFGQMCSAEKALPATVHLLVSYPDDYPEAMIANTAAGGDSAARGLLAGMVLGSHLGFSAIPDKWVAPLVHRERIEAALGKLP